MKYAIVESGGKQYIAREGETFDVDRLSANVGDEIEFEQVLLAAENGSFRIGEPSVSGAVVKARVVAQVKGPKVVVFKYKPKIRYRRKQGHRQHYTRVEVESISLPGGKKASAQEVPAEKPAEQEYDLSSMKKAELEALAEELGVMPETGSGAGGNVLVQDLRDAIEEHLKAK